MNKTCAVCHKGKGPTKCEVCGFSDNGFINRSFPIPEDAKNWLETVVKPYRARWKAHSSTPKKQNLSRFSKCAIFLFIIIVFAVIMTFSVRSDEARVKEYLDRGDAYYRRKDYDKAIEDYTAAIEIEPNNPFYLSNRGDAYYNKKEYGLATKDFKKAFQIDPNCDLAEYAWKALGFGILTDSRDGKKYKTIKIGTQTWMTENLNYNASGSRCYGNKEDNCKKYGRLYDWAMAIKACPAGWHLPSNGEWKTLFKYVGGNEIAGKKLKARSGWDDYYGSSNGTDDYRFSALPGGSCFLDDGYCTYIGAGGDWWTSSESNSWQAHYWHISNENDKVYHNNEGYSKSEHFSVRCLQN